MKHFQLGRADLGKLGKAMAEEALDRIAGDRLSLPSPHHDQINMAHARLCALVAENGPIGSTSRLLQLIGGADLDAQERRDLLDTFDIYAERPLVTNGRLRAHFRQLGLNASPENLDRARLVGVAAIAHACLAATAEAHPGRRVELGVPTPAAFALFTSPVLPVGNAALPTAEPITATPIAEPGAPTASVLDGPFSAVAEIVIQRRKDDGLWDDHRAREVRASVSLFVGVNGDIAFSSVRQEHLFAWTGLMCRLPKRYNHFMVKGQGGLPAALAAAAAIEATRIEGETAEQKRQRLTAAIGLHSGTRNKHICWLKSVVEGAELAGYTKLNLEFKGLRHGAKQIKKTDPRKRHEKRPNWTLEVWRRLTSGPVYEGCAGLDRRFHPGPTVFHDGVYWSPLCVLNICGRPSEGAGLEVNDVCDDAPIPYFHVRPNSLRGLKVDEGDRKVPIHPKLIALGFLDYVRAIRAAGHIALFPEFVHPEGKLDFAWMMRDKAIDPAKAYHFPDGTGLELHGKAPDGHSLRGTGRTALANGLPAVEEKMRNYVAGHISGRIGVDVYEEPPPLEDVLRALEKLDPWFEHFAVKPLRLRPADRMRFGGARGRPRTLN